MRVIEIDSVTKIVTQVKYVNDNYVLSANEKNSEQGEIGQSYIDGEFVDVPTEPQEPIETMEQKIVRLEKQVQSDNLILMDALAMTYEEIMILRMEMNGETT